MLALLTVSLMAVWPALAQIGAMPSFEVASVRPSNPQSSGATGTDGGPGSHDPEHYTGRGMTLRIYLCIAFDTANCQEQISGPGWIDSEKYDIVAKVPPGSTKEQFRTMLQNLLLERFRLAIHHETRTLEVFDLVIAKNGPKLKESPGNLQPPDGPPGKVQHDADGFPMLEAGRAGLVSSFGPGFVSHWTARQQTIAMLVRSLSRPLAAGRQVVDKTGLTGKYDFTLMYEMRLPGASAADDTPALMLEGALEQQLGLKLVNAKASFDMVVIDRGERVPTEN